MQDGTSACVLVVSVVSVVSADSGDSVADGPVAVLRTQGDQGRCPGGFLPAIRILSSFAVRRSLRRESMSLMSGAVYLYAELVATVRESRRPFRDSGLCGERMRRPVLPAVGEKASGRGCRVVSFDRSLGFRRSGRSFSLSGPFCPFDLLEPGRSDRLVRTEPERGFRRSGWSLRLTCPVRFCPVGMIVWIALSVWCRGRSAV